ncbi:josephin-2-like [Passerculus sandwichensis]
MALEDARAPLDLGGVELPEVGEGRLPGFGSGVPGVPYHERQRRQLCALHALNNLLQRPWLSQAQADRICQRGVCEFGEGSQGFGEGSLPRLLQRPWLSQAQADRICQRLAPNSRPNPHRSLLGLGNYDVNVVMAALGMLGLAAVWWDKRRPLERLVVPRVLGFLLNIPSPLERLVVPRVLGFLLNVPSRVSLGALALPLRRPHWLCVRPFGAAFYNLDSKLATPARIGAEPQLR